MTTKRTWIFALLAAALTITLASSNLVLGKGKPGGGDPPHEPLPIEYHLTILPSTFGEVFPLSMNNQGEVVGYYEIGESSPDKFRAFYWESGLGQPVDLNAFLPVDSDWILATARGINDAGQVVGYGYVGDDDNRHAFRFTPGDGTNDALVEDIGTVEVEHVSSDAYGINNNGDMYVEIWKTDGQHYHYLWSNSTGQFDYLLNVGEIVSLRGMNDDLDVVGWNQTADQYFFFTTESGVTYIPHYEPSDLPAECEDINNPGQISGKSWFYQKNGRTTKGSAARYTPGEGVEDLGFLGKALAINDRGDCVGYSFTNNQSNNVLYLDQSAAEFKLTDLIVSADQAQDVDLVDGSLLVDINNEQKILMWVRIDGSTTKAFVLTPVEQ